MKKTIVIETLLLIVLAVLLSCAIITLKDISSMNEYIEHFNTLPPNDANYDIGFIIVANTKVYVCKYLSIGIPAIIAAVADFTAIIITAVRDIPIIKQSIESFKAKRTARKEQRATTAKQERIDKLQAELDELKKDE